MAVAMSPSKISGPEATFCAVSLLLVILACSATSRDPEVSEVILDPSWPTQTLSLNEFPGSQIDLLDCTFASGSPNGLSCEKEGTFIVGFEKRGQWIAGGGGVPLSRALCCRLGIPHNVTSESMPNVPLTPAKPVAVVSFGCHASRANGGMQVILAPFAPWQVCTAHFCRFAHGHAA